MQNQYKNKMQKLASELDKELRDNILPFWADKMVDRENGGFYGQIDGNDNLVATADKGVILTARILWAFSAAYCHYKDEQYLCLAKRAYEYLTEYFWDTENGGVYWTLDYSRTPVDTKKQTYAQGFALYGLSEHYRATKDQKVLDKALELFETIESHCFDSEKDGYMEAYTRDWQPVEDMRLSGKDENAPKTMNTHLHIIEPYSNLYNVFPAEKIRSRIVHLLDVFSNKIIDHQRGHLGLFFDNAWNRVDSNVSYGHNIEAAWLIEEAAACVGDLSLIEKTRITANRVSEAAVQGMDDDGGVVYEYFADKKFLDREKHWWVQAEAMVGFFNMYQNCGDEKYLDLVFTLWEYIKAHLIDRTNGEWFWGVKPDAEINRVDDKAGFWKCPYHNTRMCIEIMRRIETLE